MRSPGISEVGMARIVAASSGADCFKARRQRHCGQLPWGASAGRGAPQSGQWFAEFMTVSGCGSSYIVQPSLGAILTRNLSTEGGKQMPEFLVQFRRRVDRLRDFSTNHFPKAMAQAV